MTKEEMLDGVMAMDGEIRELRDRAERTLKQNNEEGYPPMPLVAKKLDDMNMVLNILHKHFPDVVKGT